MARTDPHRDPPPDGRPIARRGGTSRDDDAPRRIPVVLPGWVARALDTHVRAGLFRSLDEAVVAGARIVATLGPRAVQMLEDGATADGLVTPVDGSDGDGRWL